MTKNFMGVEIDIEKTINMYYEKLEAAKNELVTVKDEYNVEMLNMEIDHIHDAILKLESRKQSTKEQKLKQVANLIGMLESQQNELLAEGSELDMEVSKIIDIAVDGLTLIWSDISNEEYVF